MKQVSNVIKSFVLSSPRHHSITQRKAFSKYLSVLLLAGIVLFITSCQKEELQTSSQNQDLLNSAQKQSVQKKTVPFKGKFTLAHTETGVLLNGEGSHIGRFTLFSAYGGNISTITAANGDQILATYIESSLDTSGYPMVKISLDHTITGGTGRFTGATGNFVIYALINETLGEGTGMFEGTISY